MHAGEKYWNTWRIVLAPCSRRLWGAPSGDNRLRSRGGGRGRGCREEWRLPKAVIEEMRKEFAAKMDRETAEVRMYMYKCRLSSLNLSMEASGLAPPKMKSMPFFC